MWGWGVMNQVAVQEAANVRYPMDQFIGNWWAGAEHDVTPAGDAADGYKSLNMNTLDPDLPIFDEIRATVVDAGLAAGDGSNVGSVLYTRGMYAAMLAAEAIAKAQELSGETDITPEQMRQGMAALEMTDARMDELGAPKIGPEFSVTCQNHGGNGQGLVQQWNASEQRFEPLTDFIEPDREVIDPLVAEDSMAYAEENGITPSCADS